MAQQRNLYKFVEQHCNVWQLKILLREHHQRSKLHKKKIPLSGTKPELMTTLKRAVTDGLIPREEVIDLLREAEESGQQHIFYYKPKNRNALRECRNFDEIVERLIGPEWDDQYPLFEYVPETFHWVDFRKGTSGKPNDWFAKIYGQERRFRQTRIRNPTADRRVVYYEAETIRLVCLIRWNDPDLLEVRVDSQRLDSWRAKESRLGKIWGMLQPALSPQNMVSWNLGPVRDFVKGHRNGHADFTLGDIRLRDSEGGLATFKTNTEEESIDSLPERTEAIDALVTSQCDAVRIHWNVPALGSSDEPFVLSTSCGGRYSHELVIGARTTSQAVDHVTDKLRELGSAAS